MKFENKSIFYTFFITLVLTLGSCSNDDGNNPSNEKIMALQERNNDLLEEKAKLQSTISKLQEEIGDLREKNGLARAQFWDSYGWLITFLLVLFIVPFPLWLNNYIKKERALCDERINEMESEKNELKKVIEEHKDEIRNIQTELDRLRTDSEHGERNEVVSLIKRARESRKNRVELLNKKNNENIENEEV